jgi:radical SAM protein (TIGR01212 family)
MSDRFPQCAERGYYPFSDYLRERFGGKVHKVSLHAGLTCPNRDGRVGVGGCTYCINESFNPQAGGPLRPIREQMADGIAYMRRRYRAAKVFAYFQAFSNTYAEIATLRRLYDEAIDFPEVVGLSIGTRPDCVPEETLELVQGYSERVEVWIEYGIQSIHDRTLRRINRGHDVAAFRDAVSRTRARGIRVCAHVILGLPGETHEEMMRTAESLQGLDIGGIKLHHLYVARNTALEREHAEGLVPLFTAEEYVRTACDFLERIPAGVAVQRLVGDTTSSDVLIAPQWPQSKTQVLQMITNEFRRRGTTQGERAAAGSGS